MKLEELVRVVFSHIIDECHLRLASLDDEELLLYSKSLALWVFVNNDGASVDALAQDSSRTWCDFPLGVFLVKRAGAPRSYPGTTAVSDERVEGRLRWYAGAIAEFGKDILAGKKDWIAEYPWPPAPLTQNMARTVQRLQQKSD